MPLMSLTRPSPSQVAAYLSESNKHTFNHDSVGVTKDVAADKLALPDGLLWAKDHLRVKIGEGLDVYDKTKALLQDWGQFAVGWSYVPPGTKVTKDSPVAVVAHTFFLWTVNPLRIVYNQEKTQRKRLPMLPLGWIINRLPMPASKKRWQLAHNCLEGHLLQGEESFRLEWNAKDNTVWYEMLTVSRPVHPLPILTYPITRCFQAKFAWDSVSAIKSALRADGNSSSGAQGAAPPAALSLALVPGSLLPAVGLFTDQAVSKDTGMDLWASAVPLLVGAASIGV